MKSYVWPLGDEMFVFKIGLNPLRSFQVEIILEKESQSEYVKLDSAIVSELFSVIRKLYQLNACHPGLDNSQIPGCVRIGVYNHELYNLSIKNRSMSVNDKNLLALIDFQPWILEILQIYEFERIKAEVYLFRLLEVFSEKRIPVRSSELLELITVPCSYVPIDFIIEMGTQHYNLLTHLLPIYHETKMMFKNASTQQIKTIKSESI